MFNQATSVLRERFTNPTSPGYVFSKEYNKNIPLDGFSFFCKGIWERIESERDLDIPNQQTLLAQFRCDEIGRSVWEAGFESGVQRVRGIVDKGGVQDGLGGIFDGVGKGLMGMIFRD
jgi:hypothetical protein